MKKKDLFIGVKATVWQRERGKGKGLGGIELRCLDLGARGALLLFFRKKVTKNLVAQKTRLGISAIVGLSVMLSR